MELHKAAIRNYALMLCVTLAILSHTLSFAAQKNLRFVINSPGSSPYIYYGIEHARYRGVVVDFFNSFHEADKFNVDYIDSSRSRNDHFVYKQQADLFLRVRFGYQILITLYIQIPLCLTLVSCIPSLSLKNLLYLKAINPHRSVLGEDLAIPIYNRILRLKNNPC